jgi:hypothetical protein
MSSFDAVAEPSFRQLHEALIGVALSGGIRTRYIRICHDQAELLTDAVSGDLRRNVSGAIAPLRRTIATSRSDDNRNESS